MQRKTYKQKLLGCQKIVELRAKSVNDTHIKKVADEVGLSLPVMKRAWMNFQESGGKYIDKTVSTHNGNLYIKPVIKCNQTKMRYDVSPAEAGSMLIEYMTTPKTSRELANKYKITVNQFYSYIHELNVQGTIAGVKVLDPKKYAKVEVKDVIWLRKVPTTTRKTIRVLSDSERMAYERVADVLMDYLPRMKNA